MTRANATPNNQPTVLVVEDDPDTRDSIKMVLEDAGYGVSLAASLAEALHAIDERVFALIMTDLFAHATENRLDGATTIRDHAFPTPIAILSGWNLSSAQVAGEGFAFVASKPFDIDELLTSIAKAIDHPLTEEQRRHVPLVYAYFAALGAHDWDALVALCADDIVYGVPGSGPFAQVISGKAAFREYAERTLPDFPDVHFDQIEIYGTPLGLAARYRSVWRALGQQEIQQSGSVVFQFDDLTIRQVGVRLNHEQLSALFPTARAGGSSVAPDA